MSDGQNIDIMHHVPGRAGRTRCIKNDWIYVVKTVKSSIVENSGGRRMGALDLMVAPGR